jgi:hypothetical protein
MLLVATLGLFIRMLLLPTFCLAILRAVRRTEVKYLAHSRVASSRLYCVIILGPWLQCRQADEVHIVNPILGGSGVRVRQSSCPLQGGWGRRMRRGCCRRY